MGSILLALGESSIQLVPDGTLVLHGLIILVMVAVLNLTLFKPINRILEERDRQTRGRLEEAQLTLKEIDKKLKDYERALREARAEGYQLMEQQRAEALRQREAKLSSVKEEVANFLSAQKRSIAQQADDVRSMLSSEARRLALEISARILGRSISGN
jgi:F-type H+-transporting ATPase subunit b